jgi:hypothetical protein
MLYKACFVFCIFCHFLLSKYTQKTGKESYINLIFRYKKIKVVIITEKNQEDKKLDL